MRVLVLHNRYRSDVPSGENVVVDAEVEGLRAAGVNVATHLPSSDDMRDLSRADKARIAGSAVRYTPGVRAVMAIVERHRPDVVHAHNIVPLISVAALRAVARLGVPVVRTVHNYRSTCLAGTHVLRGLACTSCTPHNPLPGAWRGCYRSSRVQSAGLAVGHLMSGSWVDHVSVHVAVSDFVKDYLVNIGLPKHKITRKYNGVPAVTPGGDPERLFVFAGRLEPEKGIDLLLRAWSLRPVAGHTLLVAGAGSLSNEVSDVAAVTPSVTFAGHLGRDAVRDVIFRSKAVIVPSLWDEPFGLSVAEAFAAGRQAVVTRRGALPELAALGPGIVAEPLPESLNSALWRAAEEDAHNARARALDAHRVFLSTEASTETLLAIYDRAIVSAESR